MDHWRSTTGGVDQDDPETDYVAFNGYAMKKPDHRCSNMLNAR